MIKGMKPLHSVRILVAGGAVAASALLTAGGVAHADYPPLPPVPPKTVVQSQTPSAVSPSQATLPSTGSGIDATLVIAGVTLLAGIGIAGSTHLSRRRHETADLA